MQTNRVQLVWRIPAVLRSTALRESRRFDLSLARGLFLLAAIVIALPAGLLPIRGTTAGSIALGMFFLPSAVLAAGLAGRLAGDAVGDRTSGVLDLLSLSGLTSGQWLIVRLIEIWIAFLSVWIVRVPLLYLIFSLGGVRFERIVVQEILLLGTFGIVSGFAMHSAHKAESRKQSNQKVMGLIIALEFLLALPKLALSGLATYTIWVPPSGVKEFADQLVRLRLASVLRSAVEGGPQLHEIGPPLAFYGLVSSVALWRLKTLLFAPPKDRPSTLSRAASTTEGQTTHSRETRRCWDDAFAWQAFCVHGRGQRTLSAKSCIYVVLFIALGVCFATGLKEFGLVISWLAAGLGLILLANKAGDCLQRELKGQTLPSLLLTPHDAADIYDGWHRGSWRLCWVDVVFTALLVAVTFSNHTAAGQVLLAVSAILVSSGPFMMLSPLVPFTFGGVVSGLGIVGGLVVIIVIGIVLCATVHPISLLVVSAPLWWLFNRWLRAVVLPRWMQKKTSAIT